jgi:DNA-binding response OmpR family regulator
MSRMRVLLIEDERELAASVRNGLVAEGYAVDVAYDGREGLLLAETNRYDAVILDIMLPRLNGYRVCAQLRHDGVTTPVLMLTAKDGEYDEAEALDTGADDYLAKPFSYLVLVARLRALIRRGGPVRPAVIRVGDLSIDVGERRCRRSGEEVRLTAKQFAVLACLARRVGQVVSKADVIDEVWDMTFDGDVNIVEVYVRALRQRLDEPFGRRSIQTVRGVGYRLVDDRA